MEMEALAQKVLQRLFVEVEASARHVHVTAEQAEILFGHPLTEKRPLSQPGQYLANERVTVVGKKGSIANVAVLGPARKEAQVEVSLTDARTLGIEAPVRLSGDVSGSAGGILIGPCGTVVLEQGFLVAKRHIHLTPQDAARFGVKDKQIVKLQMFTGRPLIFDDVQVRVSDQFASFAHLDFDEANACLWKSGAVGRILV